MTTEPAPLHHNNPPPDLLLGEALKDKLRGDNGALIKRRDELLAAEGRIPDITDNEIAGKVGDYIVQLNAASKAADGARVAAKEPYLSGGRGVDGFFLLISDPLLVAKARVQTKLTKYLRDKEAKERAERQEQERLAREAAEKADREAQEAAQKVSDEKSLDDAINAETASTRAQADLVTAEAMADVKPAELSRTRGEYGSMAGLRTNWVFDEIDRAKVDLETLRPYIPTDGLEKAVRAFIKAGGRKLKGTTIFETSNAVVR